MSPQIDRLGQKLMRDYEKVGFADDKEDLSKLSPEEREKAALDDMIRSIPKQVIQYFMEVPTQYRLIYLLAFLYLRQKEKVIVFVSNCEMANFVQALILKFDWNKCCRRVEEEESKEQEKRILFGGNVFKLHGDMEHEFRKKNYFGFDK